MKTSAEAKKYKRLEARIPAELKEQIELAAALLGDRPTTFVINSIRAAAEETIRSHRVMELTVRETEAFFAALENPPEPNEALRRAAKRHDSLVSG